MVGAAGVIELGIEEVLGIGEFDGLADGEEVGNCRVAGMAGGWCRTGDGVGDCGWTELV